MPLTVAGAILACILTGVIPAHALLSRTGHLTASTLSSWGCQTERGRGERGRGV